MHTVVLGRRVWLLGILGFLLFTGLTGSPLPAAAVTSRAGQIGGAPTYPLGAPDEGKQTTAARVIGVGRTYDGWLQIDAYGWRPPSDSSGDRREVCVWAEFQTERFATYGSCVGAGDPGASIAIESAPVLVKPKRLRSTQFGGILSPDVTRVVLTVKRSASAKPVRAEATVARVSGRLQHQMKQSRPFGYFFAKLPGEIAPKEVRAVAYNAAGKVVGSTSGLSAQF
jgi:hypothetical protein